MNVFGVCNDETQIKRYFFWRMFLNFNGLNELACGRELHPIKGILATRLLKVGFRFRIKYFFKFFGWQLPFRMYLQIEWWRVARAGSLWQWQKPERGRDHRPRAHWTGSIVSEDLKLPKNDHLFSQTLDGPSLNFTLHSWPVLLITCRSFKEVTMFLDIRRIFYKLQNLRVLAEKIYLA